MSSLKDVMLLKSKLKTLQKSKEIVSAECFKEVSKIVYSVNINNEEDAFLYFTALTVLNTAIKQNRYKLSYNFKFFVSYAFEIIMDKKINASFYVEPGEKGALIVNIAGVQFSFHRANLSERMIAAKSSKYYVPQTWEQIRLRPCVETLFNYAKNLDGLSTNLTQTERCI